MSHQIRPATTQHSDSSVPPQSDMPRHRSTTQQHMCQVPNKNITSICLKHEHNPRRVNVYAEKYNLKTEDNLVNQCVTAQHFQREVRSVPESFLRQSVSTTVCPAVGEKHFRGGMQRRQGNMWLYLSITKSYFFWKSFLSTLVHPNMYTATKSQPCQFLK